MVARRRPQLRTRIRIAPRTTQLLHVAEVFNGGWRRLCLGPSIKLALQVAGHGQQHHQYGLRVQKSAPRPRGLGLLDRPLPGAAGGGRTGAHCLQSITRRVDLCQVELTASYGMYLDAV